MRSTVNMETKKAYETRKVPIGKGQNFKMPSKNTKMAAKALSQASSSFGVNSNGDEISSKMSGAKNLKSVGASDGLKAGERIYQIDEATNE